MKTRYNLIPVVLLLIVSFASASRGQDNQVSDCASVTPKGGIKLPSVKVGSSSHGELVVKNISANKVVISAVDEDGGGHHNDFSVDETALPVTLMPGESHSFTCTYAPTPAVPWTGGTFAVYVFRFAGSDLDTSICHYINFVLSGDTLGTQSGVAQETKQGELTLYPNPATDKIEVGISGGFIKSLEVFDALGKSIVTAQNTTSWSWDLRSSSGVKVPAGVYFVRAVVIGSNGEYVTTKKVVVK